jgi:4-hydroxyphenylacetate 3-monooxygenase
MGMAYFDAFDKEPFKEMVKEFLGRVRSPKPHYVKA